MFAYTSKSEAEACLVAISEVSQSGVRVKRSLELSPLVLSIPFDPSKFEVFSKARVEYGRLLGVNGVAAINRTDRVYTSSKGRITKPSYRERLENYPDVVSRPVLLNSVNQIDKISEEMSRCPRASNHSFVFMRPADLYEKRRPGYVPCPIAGDFKLRKGSISLNVMFRSCDVLNFLYSDIYYLRRLQREVLDKVTLINEEKFLNKTRIGDMNLFLSRAFIQTWEIKDPRGYVGLVEDAKEFLSKIV